VKHGLRFYTVGAAGMVVQLAVFTLLTRGLNVGYLLATAIAVELAVLHNFCWHERWTWADRLQVSAAGQAGRLFRFHLSNGIFSILGNLALMALLVGRLHAPPVPANVVAIGVCSLLNFLAADRFVFRAPEQGE
jgi:putative flippase GtrA